MSTKHTLSVLVENTPGILARIAALFSRRGFNLDSVSEGTTQDPGISRLTIVVDAEVCPKEQVVKQIGKLVNVLKVVDFEPGSAITTEIALLKVRADNRTRSQIVEIVQLFRARIVDVVPESVTIEATGTTDRLAALLNMLRPYGIKELVQSGTVAIGRGARSALDSTAQDPTALHGIGPGPWRATA
ncbi:acetolactate synthase small subunit (plasmid) [Streptomyces sp. NBC_00435]|uniref:acetolactate synthase small subunit n=1 Tax=Streptomyces sp. NBC_00435 TaxID=2903649 RepID=UPI002E250DEA